MKTRLNIAFMATAALMMVSGNAFSRGSGNFAAIHALMGGGGTYSSPESAAAASAALRASGGDGLIKPKKVIGNRIPGMGGSSEGFTGVKGVHTKEELDKDYESKGLGAQKYKRVIDPQTGRSRFVAINKAIENLSSAAQSPRGCPQAKMHLTTGAKKDGWIPYYKGDDFYGWGVEYPFEGAKEIQAKVDGGQIQTVYLAKQ